MKKITSEQQVKAEQRFPGVGSGEFLDNGNVTKKMVECDVKSLNNNPRSNEIDEKHKGSKPK